MTSSISVSALRGAPDAYKQELSRTVIVPSGHLSFMNRRCVRALPEGSPNKEAYRE